jgi:SAM-dependent methyltransferase
MSDRYYSGVVPSSFVKHAFAFHNLCYSSIEAHDACTHANHVHTIPLHSSDEDDIIYMPVHALAGLSGFGAIPLDLRPYPELRPVQHTYGQNAASAGASPPHSEEPAVLHMPVNLLSGACSQGPVLQAQFGNKTVRYKSSSGSETTGRRLWDCSRWLYNALESKGSLQGKRVLELGAGTGALSMACALGGAAYVIATDLSCHVQQMRCNFELNWLQGQMSALEVVWGEPITNWQVQEPFDLILCCECLYWPALDILQTDTLQPLAATISSLLRAGSSMCVLAYKVRDASREERFLQLCKQAGLTVTPVQAAPLAGASTEEPGAEALRMFTLRVAR